MPSSDIGAPALGKHVPLTRTVPLSGRSRPAIIRIVVDLPAPFGPRNPVTTPGCTTKLKPSTAVLSPYRLVRPSISIMLRPFADDRNATDLAASGHLSADRTFAAE